MSAELARQLVHAEAALRAEGLTGGQAFSALVHAVERRLGSPHPPHVVADALVASLPLDTGVDLLGLAYERFFPELFKGKRGQYFTPRPLVELALSRLPAIRGCTVLDPTCGSGGFLVCAARAGARVRGIELNPELASLARLNLRLAGADGQVSQQDFFLAEPAPVDVVLANPPFSVRISGIALKGFELAQGRSHLLSDWLFVEALERWVRPGGWAAVILPWTLVTNPRTAVLRARIDANWRRHALCALPEGVFRPFGGAAGRACMLWLERGGPPGSMQWATLEDPGWDVRSQRLQHTDPAPLRRLVRGVGWRTLPANQWVPLRRARGVPLRQMVSLRTETVRPACAGEVGCIDLADSDKRTGEVVPIRVQAEGLRSSKVRIHGGDLLVSRLRPELGNVALVVESHPFPLVGSTEWIVLEAPALRHALLVLLRSPAWRAQLPLTGGQTRPRTTPQAVLDTHLRLPSPELVERVDRVVQRCLEVRAEAREALMKIQHQVDAFAAGELDDAELSVALDAIALPERGLGG